MAFPSNFPQINCEESELVHTLFLKNPDIAISLNDSLILSGTLGALGRRFESCRPDQLLQ